MSRSAAVLGVRSRRAIAVALAGALSTVSGLAVGAVHVSATHARLEHLSSGSINGNDAIDVRWVGATDDGTRVFFETDESLVDSDTDGTRDLYERSGGTTQLVSVGTINGNGPYWARYRGVSADGTIVFFTTEDPLEPTDTDAVDDVYQRSGGVTTQVSVGAVGGNGAFEADMDGMSDEGSTVFFTTSEALVTSDSDASQDVYQRAGGVTTRLSKGTINGNGAFYAYFEGSSTDGSRVLIRTAEQLDVADTDASEDLYERSGSVTTLISAGTINGNGAFDVTLEAVASDGGRVVFATAEQLVSGDTDASIDLYRRENGSTYLVSWGEINGNGAYDVAYEGASDDATHVFFATYEQLATSDTDTSRDVYDRSGGVTSQVSVGVVNGNGSDDVSFSGSSSDGTIVFFRTGEALVTADADTWPDLYERSGGVTTWISAGTVNGSGPYDVFWGGASTDGSTVIFRTGEQLVLADTDAYGDAYERVGGTTKLVSPGLGAGDLRVEGVSSDASAIFYETDEAMIASDEDASVDIYGAYPAVIPPAAGVHTRFERSSTGPADDNGHFYAEWRGSSVDASRIFFVTAEDLVSADTDTSKDVYERFDGKTRLVSRGGINGNGVFDAQFVGASEDGTRVFFETSEALVSADTDTAVDVYQRSSGGTRRISAGAINGNGAVDAEFVGASADGTRVFFETTEQLGTADTDTARDLYRRQSGVTTRMSSGSTGGNGAFDVTFDGTSSDGTHVVFHTSESLVAGDTDGGVPDVYERNAGVTSQVSAGAINGNGLNVATYTGASDDGTRVFFSTTEALVTNDTDLELDVYRRSGGSTTRISRGSVGGNGADPAFFVGSSSDGLIVFFSTTEQLVAGDTDASYDVYKRNGGATSRVTIGAVNGNGAFDATFQGASDDGTTVFFETSEPLSATDTDTSVDVYQRTTGATRQVSTGVVNGNGPNDAYFSGSSSDADTVVFTTDEPLVASDTDIGFDLYVRKDDSHAAIEAGSSDAGVMFHAISADGSSLIFWSYDAVMSDDTDAMVDIYAAYRVESP